MKELEYYPESEISTEFIPGGSIMNFVPGGSDLESGYFGKKIENGEYIGLVRMWAGDRRMDWKLRVKDEELEEKRDFYFKSEQFSSSGWDSSWGTWDWGIVKLEGVTHSLRTFIELHLEQASYDEINEIWWEEYQEHY